MDIVYGRIIQLLGKNRYGPEFEEFLAIVGEEPIRIVDHELLSIDVLRKTGLFMHLVSNQIEEIGFHLSTSTEEHGKVGCYRGDLPYGITRTDERTKVLEKLGVIPLSKRVRGPGDLHDYWDYFDMQPLKLVFIFDGTTRRIAELTVLQSDFELRRAQDLFSRSYR